MNSDFLKNSRSLTSFLLVMVLGILISLMSTSGLPLKFQMMHILSRTPFALWKGLGFFPPTVFSVQMYESVPASPIDSPLEPFCRFHTCFQDSHHIVIPVTLSASSKTRVHWPTSTVPNILKIFAVVGSVMLTNRYPKSSNTLPMVLLPLPPSETNMV